jgi:hypothetical protein
MQKETLQKSQRFNEKKHRRSRDGMTARTIAQHQNNENMLECQKKRRKETQQKSQRFKE